MNLDQVLTRVYIGSYPASITDIDRLKDEYGITAVLSVQTDDDLERLGLDWPVLEAYYREVGIEVCRVPARDFDENDLRRKLPQAVAALDRFLKAGHTVFVHCTAGMGRAPTTVIAYLVWCENWDIETAAVHVSQHRTAIPNLRAIAAARRDAIDG